ncbi:hypothetical protein [Caldimonas sp.]|uniref:hypothetical protein n=1 Tax=Caldimonas sp. TaxID=2838790 RepID=UPI00391B1E8F
MNLNLSKLMDKIVGRQQKRQQERVASFCDLVKHIAAGQEPDADLVDEVLHNSGKSLNDLKAAVELRQKRLALRAQLDRVPDLTKEREANQKHISEAYAELQKAEERCEAVARPLIYRNEQLTDEIREADRAKNQLANTCPYEELLTTIAEVVAEIKAVNHKINDLTGRIQNCHREAGNLRQQASVSHRPDDADRLRAKADAFERGAKEMDAKVSPLRTQMADLQRRETELRERLLEP